MQKASFTGWEREGVRTPKGGEGIVVPLIGGPIGRGRGSVAAIIVYFLGGRFGNVVVAGVVV